MAAIKQMLALVGSDGCKAFNYLLIHKNKQRRWAQLFQYAGPDVEDIFYTLENTGEANDYTAAINALNDYFAPRVNSAFARHTFRQHQQNAGETVM